MTDQRTAEIMRSIASALDQTLNGDERPGKVAFVVLTANFDQIERGKVNYVSNANRDDTKAMLKELIGRWEGRVDPAPEGQQ